MRIVISSKLVFLILYLLAAQAAVAQNMNTGKWSGYILIKGYPLEIHTNVWQEQSGLTGLMDIPAQSLQGMRLEGLRMDQDSVHFKFDAGVSYALFDGFRDGDTLRGAMRQSGYAYRFALGRSGEGERPVYPPDSGATYTATEVSFANGVNQFAGTLTVPEGNGPFPAIILITGSGASDRDETAFGFHVFRRLAHFLSNAGYAVLRYDDRNTGCSSGTPVAQSTTAEFAGDVIAAYKYLLTRKEIDAHRIGLLGHSEGGIVAPLAASQEPGIAFIILMGGTGVKGHDVIKAQSEAIAKASGVSAEKTAEQLKEFDEGYAAWKDSAKWQKMKVKKEKLIRKELKKMADARREQITDPEAYIAARMKAAFGTFESPWFAFFLDYDPAPALQKVKCPVLMLFGEKDLQVLPSQNEEPMLDALEAGKNADYKSVIIPTANHLFQEAETGAPNEYASLPKAFVPEFEQAILDWLKPRFTR